MAEDHFTGYVIKNKLTPCRLTVEQDGLGGNGGVTKPDPMLTLDVSGTFENLRVVNSPQRAVSVNGKSSGALTVTGVTVDNCKCLQTRNFLQTLMLEQHKEQQLTQRAMENQQVPIPMVSMSQGMTS